MGHKADVGQASEMSALPPIADVWRCHRTHDEFPRSIAAAYKRCATKFPRRAAKPRTKVVHQSDMPTPWQARSKPKSSWIFCKDSPSQEPLDLTQRRAGHFGSRGARPDIPPREEFFSTQLATMAASVAEPTGALLLRLFKAYLPKRYARRSSSVPLK